MIHTVIRLLYRTFEYMRVLKLIYLLFQEYLASRTEAGELLAKVGWYEMNGKKQTLDAEVLALMV